MKLIKSCVALAAIFVAYTGAVAVPNGIVSDVTERAGNATEPTLDAQVLAHLSTWFGWQLAGGAKVTNDNYEGCGDLSKIGGERWKKIGLVPSRIKQPLCNMTGGPDPQHAFPNSIPAISAIISHQLVGSFPAEHAKETFSYLCDNLASFQIDQFFITDDKLLAAVCRRAGKQVPPRAFGTEAGRPISKSAGAAAKNTASILYATTLAAGQESGGKLNVLCAHAPEHIDNLNAEQLNGTLVQDTLCSFTGPIGIDEAREKILSWTSRLFVTVLENIGDAPDWLEWLCEHLDEQAMNSVGLIGWGSKLQVCEDAAKGSNRTAPGALPAGISCNGTDA